MEPFCRLVCKGSGNDVGEGNHVSVFGAWTSMDIFTSLTSSFFATRPATRAGVLAATTSRWNWVNARNQVLTPIYNYIYTDYKGLYINTHVSVYP